MNIPISLVCLSVSRPSTGKAATFLGVAEAGFMADDVHNMDLANMDLAAFFIDGQAFIFFGELRIPALQGTIETIGIDADQRLSESRARRDLANTVTAPAAKAFPCFWA